VVVFASTTGDVLDPAQQNALEGFLRRGGGFVGVHAAADTEYDWPWYGRLVGAYFLSHPKGLQSTRVQPERDGRPDGTAWPIRDELYNYRSNPASRCRWSTRWTRVGTKAAPWARITRSPGATPSRAAAAGTRAWVTTRRSTPIRISSRGCGAGCATLPASHPAAEIQEKPVTVITSIEDLRVLAQKRVPRMFYDYVDSGAWTESTYRANTSDFAAIKLRQRVAVNMEGRSTATTMIGQPVAMPVAIAPTGLAGMQHADGEILAARAAKAFGIPFTLSTMSICSIEDVAETRGAGLLVPAVRDARPRFHRAPDRAGPQRRLQRAGAHARPCRSSASATRTSRTA
jgi:hypothetical protein